MSIRKSGEIYLASFRGYQLWGNSIEEVFTQIRRLT